MTNNASGDNTSRSPAGPMNSTAKRHMLPFTGPSDDLIAKPRHRGPELLNRIRGWNQQCSQGGDAQ